MNRSLKRAWIAVACIPVAFVVAMVVGEGLITALGYSGDEDPPLWAALAVGLPLTIAATVPGVLAAIWGRRARREGAGRAALAAMIIGAVVSAYWVLTTAGSLIGRAFD